MNYLQILETTCATDVSSCCSDYGIAMFLYIMQKALELIHLVIPILLLVMATIQLTKMMISPDDKKSSKSLLNKFIAAVLVFFTPYIINLTLGVIQIATNNSFHLASCWESAEVIAQVMQSSTKYEVLNKTDKRKKVVNVEKYKIIKAKDEKSKKNTKADSSSSAGKKIVNYALQFVGNPYRLGGKSLTSGCDCSGFVYLVLKDVGAYDGEYVTSQHWAGKGKKVEGGLKNAQAGDVVVYAKGSHQYGHVGIYDGKGKLIEAKGSAYGITHDRSANIPTRTILGVRRFV